MKISPNSPCPCGSSIKYKKCCKLLHNGAIAKTALELMKSRYCAYVVNNSEYIIKTTHSNNNDYSKNLDLWSKSISEFTLNTQFEGLEIIEFIEAEDIAFVTFKAKLFQNNEDVTFTEKSKFLKEGKYWLYESGEFL